MVKKLQAKTEILSGLTISIALVPEAISFALLVGAPPQVGLWAAFFMAATAAFFGGRPGLISGATGATAVIMAGLVAKAGLDSLFVGVILAGLIQLLIWATSAWKIFKKIPRAAISGFLISLAVLILISQFKYFNVGSPDKMTRLYLASVILAAAGSMVWASRTIKIPPALVAILIGTIVGLPLGLATVGDISQVSASLPSLQIPKVTIDLILKVLPYSFGMAVAGLTESLLTVDAVSHKLNLPGDKGKETFAQGLGNTISGLFGSMGGCVLVGQTNLNIAAGAKNRLSGITAAFGLAVIILFLGKYIEQIPLAGLIGVMLVVVYETGDWRSLVTGKLPELIVISLTVIASLITHNLAIGVMVGSIAHYFSKITFKNRLS